ncbi:MAG TPA: MMPL family transporter, partial [Spongiibacteraceae bacterium]|nr:MMPL family transporter [Spongiibacteraceae bacterium]
MKITAAGKWPVLIWLALLIVALSIVARTNFSADFSAFLPAAPTPQQQVLVDQLQNGVVARLLLLGIEGGSDTARATASQQLAARLRAQTEFVAVNNGEAIALERDRDYLFANRYLLSPAVTEQRFTVEGLSAAIGEAIDTLASPAGLMLKTLIGSDPTAEFLQLLDQLNPTSAPQKQAGVWIANSGQRALLLLQTAAAGADTDAQQIALEKIRTAFAAVKDNAGADGATLRLQITGPGVFAVNARDTIRTQAERLAAISLLFIAVFLLFIYRSWRLLALGLLPVATAIIVGIAAVALHFGTVHGITLGFGTTLVGEAVDYAIYFFVQAHGNSLVAWRRDFWPTIRLGVIISVCGFATLLFSGFPGLAQLGLYSIAGLIAAALTARYVLPQLLIKPAPIEPALLLGRRLQYALARIHPHRHDYFRGGLIVLALGCSATIATHRDTLWNESLGALSPVTLADQALDAQLRAELNAPDVRYLIAASAPDAEAALQRAEQIGAVLQPLIERGAIAGFETPSRYLPSRATQQARQHALPEATVLETHLRAALHDQPLRFEALAGFIADTSAAKRQPPLQRSDLNGTSFALAVDSLLQQRGASWQALLPLQALPDGEIPAAEIRAALRGLALDNVWLIDITGESQALYSGYFREALHLSLFGLAAIGIVLAAHLRSLRRLGNVIAPLSIAVLLVMATLVLAQQRLNLLHLIGLFLIVAVGSNYALFFARA